MGSESGPCTRAQPCVASPVGAPRGLGPSCCPTGRALLWPQCFASSRHSCLSQKSLISSTGFTTSYAPLTPNLLNVTSKVPASVRCGILLFPTYCSFVSSKFSFCRST